MTRLLLVFKRSFLEQHGAERDVIRRLDPPMRRRLIRSDLENRLAIQDAVDVIRRLRLKCDVVWRGQLASMKPYTLVITVGGDGTLLSAAHAVGTTPVLAVNSDPTHSLGLFAGADRRTFESRLRAALDGRLRAVKLTRLRVRVNGKPLPQIVLNDLLFADRNPAAMSRYVLTVDARREAQRSSGLWISTAAGSTAGIYSSGGAKMPITSTQIQVLAREPYRWETSGYALAHAFARRRVTFQALMTDAAIWLDGPRIRHALRYGDVVELSSDAPSLTLLGFNRRRRDALFTRRA